MMLSDFDAAGWLAAFLLCGFVRGADCIARSQDWLRYL